MRRYDIFGLKWSKYIRDDRHSTGNGEGEKG